MGPEDVLGGSYEMWDTGAARNLKFLQAVAADRLPPPRRPSTAFMGGRIWYPTNADGVELLGERLGASPAPGIPANIPGFAHYGKKSWQTETSGQDPAWLSPSSGFPAVWRGA